jgi:hypothetical protein
MLGRKAVLVAAVAAAVSAGTGAAVAATHGGAAHARPAAKPKFHPPRAIPHHFCHPGKKGSELDSLLD